MAITDGGDVRRPGEPDEDSDESAWLDGPWYESGFGVGIVAFDVLLTVVLVYATAGYVEFDGDGDTANGTWVTPLDVPLNGPAEVPIGVIPWYVYVFSLLGALGYVFTALFDDFDRRTGKVFADNFRLPAALPLGAGVFLLADVLLGDPTELGPLILGIVFLVGLYVNLAYERFGALAERFLPASTDNGPNERRPDEDEDDSKHGDDRRDEDDPAGD